MRKLGFIIVALILSILMTSCTSTETDDPSKPTTPLATEKSNEAVKDEAGEEDQRQALEMSLDFKTIDFTVDSKDYEATLTPEGLSAIREETKPFLTSSYYEVYFIDRYMTLPIQVAHIEKAKLHPENIQAKIRDHKSDWIVVEYTLDLKFTDQGGKVYKSIPLWGDITFLQKDGEWRIQDDTYDMKPFTEIINNAS